ncbi:unnamed protein product [Tuber aestivum]|uniref:Uncharacterized protein n=1 Tax=Tuber aestivum TaxID=59557 RepID=A0A292PU46_9PEZI|nr:unnamed protein product [Tuber aestivum]
MIDCLGNLASCIRGQKFDLEQTVKRCVEIDPSELPPKDQDDHNLLQKMPLLVAGKMESLHLNPRLKDIMSAQVQASTCSPLHRRPRIGSMSNWLPAREPQVEIRRAG